MSRPRQTVTVLEIDQLSAHPGNIREGLGDLEDMARSIREHGIVQPLTVTEHSGVTPAGLPVFRIIDGHRRYGAARLAHETKIPAIIRHGLASGAEHTVLMLVTGVHRRQLRPVERAKAYARLRDEDGLNMSEIARLTGTSPSQVSTYLNLLRLDSETLQKVEAGDVPVGNAISVVREERQSERVQAGTPVRGRPKYAYFGREHQLAPVVAQACRHATQYGGVGCGACWEAAIREDALAGSAVGA